MNSAFFLFQVSLALGANPDVIEAQLKARQFEQALPDMQELINRDAIAFSQLEQKILKNSQDWLAHFYFGWARINTKTETIRAIDNFKDCLRLYARHSTDDAETKSARRASYRSFLAYAHYLSDRVEPINNPIAAEDEEPGTTFQDVSQSSGLSGAQGKRFAIVDIDADGWQDIIVGGQLWQNQKGRFRKFPGIRPFGGSAWLCGDLDNDGHCDVVTLSKSGVRILKNHGNGNLEEVTRRSKFLGFPSLPEGNALIDVNQDGLLDLYVAIYESTAVGRLSSVKGNADRFYLNHGQFVFREESEPRGLASEKFSGRGVNCADFDNDGDSDIFVANYRVHQNLLFQNDGTGVFVERSRDLGVSGNSREGWYGNTIGACWGDLDNDLDLDLICANLCHPRDIDRSDKTMVLQNMGEAGGWKFKNVFPNSGIEYEETHADVSTVDIDNDGDLDVYFTSVYEHGPSFLYQNIGNFKFQRITWRSRIISFGGWGHAWFDYDRDGDMDLVTSSGKGPTLFQNQLEKHDGADRAWVQFSLAGSQANRSAVGARIVVTAGGQPYMRDVYGGRGTTSQDSLVQHFGLDEYTGTVDVEVRWGKDNVQRRKAVPINKRWKLTEK